MELGGGAKRTKVRGVGSRFPCGVSSWGFAPPLFLPPPLAFSGTTTGAAVSGAAPIKTKLNTGNDSSSPVGSRRNTVSRVLFRRKELTEPHWVVLQQARWVLRKKLGEFALAHKKLAERNSLSSLPGTRWAQKNSLSSVFETVLPETIFGPFPFEGREWGVGSVVVGSAFGAPRILPQVGPEH